ncbi:acyl-CoA thioesterase [Bacteroidales bacterium M08MB]|nr:acyl-CoA thioesterase [Perlabentimonas gracilis]
MRCEDDISLWRILFINPFYSLNLPQKAMAATMTRVIFPKYTNHHKTLFGGQALKWMDELAFIAVSQAYQKDFVTVKVDSVKFLKPVHQNEVVEFTAAIVSKGRVKVDVDVSGFVVKGDEKEKVISGSFCLAPVSEDGRPVRL